MSRGCPDFLTHNSRTIAVIPQYPSLPATLSRRPMVKIANKSERHEPSDSATLKTMDTKQKKDIKQQAQFMKQKVAPLSYLMGAMNIDGTFSMASMQADVFFLRSSSRFKRQASS